MTDVGDLNGIRVLILEDDFYLATDLQAVLEAAGAVVIGPFAGQGQAVRAIDAARPDCALVDVNLGNGPSFDLPQVLQQRDVPFAFVTGYDAATMPAEFRSVPQLNKPVDHRRVVDLAGDLLSSRRG